MISRILLFIFSISLSLLFSNCSGTKKYAKKAEKFAENGFYKQAADYYLISLRKKNTNIDARMGLITYGQKVMDDHLREFYVAHNSENHKKAVYSYLEAREYYGEVNKTGVELKMPDYYEDYYKEDLNKYLTSRYLEGSNLLNTNNYTDAHSIFAEINRLDPDFKDADQLALLSKIEPLYIKAEEAFDRSNYREAYNHYSSVLKHDNNYKDASEKRNYALKKATLTIAIINENQSFNTETEQLNAHVLKSIIDTKNPFITVIDRSNVDKIMAEQKIGMSGAVNQNSAISAGNLMGAKVVMLGKVTSLKKVDGRMTSNVVTGYKKVRYQVYDKKSKSNQTYVRYDKTNYTTYYKKNEVEVSYQYKLISVSTGEILKTDVFSVQLDDALNYANYDGNAKDLYPKLNATSTEKNRLDQLINGKKTIATPNQLISNIYDSISKKVADKIIDYEKNRL